VSCRDNRVYGIQLSLAAVQRFCNRRKDAAAGQRQLTYNATARSRHQLFESYGGIQSVVQTWTITALRHPAAAPPPCKSAQ